MNNKASNNQLVQDPTPSPQESSALYHPADADDSSKRSSYGTAALLAAFMTYLAWGLITMEVPGKPTWPGPHLFPVIVVVAGYSLAVLLAVQAWRSKPSTTAEHLKTSAGVQRSILTPKWRALLIALVTLVVFGAILEPAGWLIAGTILFWGMAVSLGSRRFLFDLAVAAVVSSTVQLAFSAGLGLQLPVGLLGGI